MDHERAFDFLEGQWDARCRVPSGDGWEEAPGSLNASRILDGLVSLEFFEGIYHGGAVKGLGLRAFNRETGEWEHTWTDNLAPGNFHVWKGVFVDGKIDSGTGVPPVNHAQDARATPTDWHYYPFHF